jgi:hypothetical protein
VQVGGPECLADTDDASGFSLSAIEQGFYIGATSSGSGGGVALGFGLLDLPENATLVDARFVAKMDISSVGLVPPGGYATGGWSPTPVRYPTLGIEFSSASSLLRYTLDAPSSGTGQVEVVGSPIAHLFPEGDYVIAGIGTPDTGTFGLCPHVYIADPWWQFPAEDNRVFVSYMAIRVTYTTAGLFPLQRWPDGIATGPSRQWPRRVTRRPGTY